MKKNITQLDNIISDKNLFFTSDTHFFHGNIIKFSNRPFSSVGEMNETLIRNWNETVPEDGTVFHLGDFAFGGSSEWTSVLDRLNGKIILILGNHDLRNLRQGVANRFEYITQQMIIVVNRQRIILNHYPLLCFGGSYGDTWQFFGHVHSGPNSKSGLDIPRLQHLFPMQYDVGVDNNDYRPVSFRQIQETIKQQLKN